MPAILKPKNPTAPDGSPFGGLDLQEDDTLHFLGDGGVEVVRGGKVSGRLHCPAYMPSVPLRKLSKRAAPESSQRQADGKQKSSKNIPPGAKWITVHPHGEDSKGVPVLIMPQSDGSARVIGGAGGKLNMLKIKGLASPEEWRERAKNRAAKKRKEAKTKEQQLTEAEAKLQKKKEREIQKVRDRYQVDNAADTLAALNRHGVDHGLSDKHVQALLNPVDPDTDPDEFDKWKHTADAATKQVQAIHQAYEHKLVSDHTARAAARLGDHPLSENQITQNQGHEAIDPSGGESLGSLVQVGERWAAVGPTGNTQTFENWEDAAAAHVANVQQAEQQIGVGGTQGDSFYHPSQWVSEPSSQQLPEGFEFNPQAALAIAQLSQERKAADKVAREGIKKDKTGLEVIDGITAKVKDITQTSVIAKLEAEAQTLEDAWKNKRFLDAVAEGGDAGRMRSHLQLGGYSGLAGLASDVLKTNPLPRDVVNALGHSESAKLLAHIIRKDQSDIEYERTKGAVARHHAERSARVAEQAAATVEPMVKQLAALHEQILAIQELNGDDLSAEQQMQMDTLVYDAETLDKSIQKTLGHTLGDLEASAALVAAMGGKQRSLAVTGDAAKKLADKLPVEGDELPSLLGSYGLNEDDYATYDSADGPVVEIKESGLDKLSDYKPDDREAYERAMAIKRGDMDEEHYIPKGFSHYAAASFSDAGDEAKKFDTALDLDGLASLSDSEVEGRIRGYVGARVANGDNPLHVLNDVRSPDLYLKLGKDPYGPEADKAREVAVDLVRRATGGGEISDRSVIDAFQEMGDAEAAKQRRARQTDDMQALHSQTLEDDHALEAGHRTLAAMPLARTMFKAWPDLSARERKMIREYGITEVWGQDLALPKEKKDKGDTPDDVAEDQVDLFGNIISAREALGEPDGAEHELNQWQEFSKLMGGSNKAYAAVRDHLAGKFSHRFANAYGAISGKPLNIGGEPISHVQNLLLAKLPENQREEMLAFMQERDSSDRAKARSRRGGKFVSEIDDEWMERYEQMKGSNRQTSLLTMESAAAGNEDSTNYQRTTLGNAAHAQLAGIMQQAIPNFEQVDNAVDIIPEVNWSAGTPHVTKQRAFKFLESQKKVGIHFGAGSGKTSIMLGSFTHLHAQGKAKKMIVAAPSGVVGQFAGEAVTFLEPGKYKYNANLGWNREQRIAAYKDDTQIHVTTRESLTNDILHLVEKHQGVSGDRFRSLTEAQQKDAVKSALLSEGIDPESMMFACDEAHDITGRGGVEAANRSIVLNALGHHAGHYMQATGDMIKNDLTEAYNFLHSVAPDRFTDMKAFMARYGGGSPGANRALQRAIAPYSYAASTRPRDKATGKELTMHEHQPKIEINDHIANQRQQILDDVATISAWQSRHRDRLKGEKGALYQAQPEDFAAAWDDPKVRAAVDRLGSADTWGQMSEEEQQQAIAGQVQAIGGLKRTALDRLYHRTDFANNPKAQWVVNHAIDKFKKEGKPSVVFSASSQAGQMLVDEMKSRGMRVGYIHGGLGPEQKSQERIKFSPSGGGEAEYDILVCTDAARTGLNLTRGKVLYHYDTPLTEMSYSQRSARIHRLKQTTDTEVYTPQLDAPEERAAWARMQRKGDTASPLKNKADAIDDTGLAQLLEAA